MQYKRIKWLILWIPTVTIALWEYLRHTFLLPYLSMELGNLLAPIIVLIVTLTLVRKLMRMLEQAHESLQRERAVKAGLVEREQLARELHDGISQSLFLLAVKLDKLENETKDGPAAQTVSGLKGTVRRIYDDVRQSIANLHHEPAAAAEDQWLQVIVQLAEELERTGIHVAMDWRLSETGLTSKEKIELIAIIREAMLNVQKHAEADRLDISARGDGHGGFRCTVQDNGIGADLEKLEAKGRYGIRMMQGRANEMGWQLMMNGEPPLSPDETGGQSAGSGLAIILVKKGEI
ncbi:two-component system nitrate/nitrite sensor histidine kinase NarQ [Paenibacillus phyllosphaerae]|uniref:histidine kinase n=1 Tax=Paenibacillus phyllosphaerae TaxID=274593 RepID=A0A7W5FRT7_9BACL|nr:histidine kinase [Paenibacillus phyllosphaerae]MBB3114359.1 two-component system nitrate/nitrite sensor histidine kinase NarQ [Paenibacillus phyllosphaerae]